MKESELVEMMLKMVKECIVNKLPEDLSISFNVGELSRNISQGVMSLIAIVEIEGECPLCGSDPVPLLDKIHDIAKNTLDKNAIAHGEQWSNIDPIVLAMLGALDLTDAWRKAKDDPEAMRNAVRLGMKQAALLNSVPQHVQTFSPAYGDTPPSCVVNPTLDVAQLTPKHLIGEQSTIAHGEQSKNMCARIIALEIMADLRDMLLSAKSKWTDIALKHINILQDNPTLDIARLTPKHLISKDPQGYMKCSCGLVMMGIEQVKEHIDKVNGSIAHGEQWKGNI